ncbi:outer membrane beta-barrel protein [Porphyromonas sp.]
MKKLLLLGAAVAGLATAQAQITVHPRAEVGVNVSNLSVKSDEPSKEQQKALVGLRIGGAAEITLPITLHPMATLYVAPGLQYRQLGTTVTDPERPLAEGKVRVNALTVPVNLGVRVALSDFAAVSLEAGPNFSYALSAELISTEDKNGNHSKVYNLLKKASKDAKDPAYKRFEAGFGVSAALEYNKYFVRVGADLGLNNLSNIEKNSVKTSDFHIGVGYRF